MSPKRLTNLALIVASISVLGIMLGVLFHPSWGPLNWWPAAGLGISFLLTAVAFVKGASMAAQKQMDLMDRMNDCNAGILDPDSS